MSASPPLLAVTPPPSPTLTLTASPAPTTALTPTPSASPAPTASPPLAGVWASQRVTEQQIGAALLRHGSSGPTVITHGGSPYGFVDYIVFELAIGADGSWTETDVPDDLPWDVGWTGSYARSDDGSLKLTSSDGACTVELSASFAAAELSLAVVDDSCSYDDLLQQAIMYESMPFRRVDGPGAPTATLQAAGSASPASGASTSAGRLLKRPLGTVGGAPLGYLEYLPPDYGHGAASPLLVALHGSGQSGPGTAASLGRLYQLGIPPLIRNNQWPDSRPFVVLAPQHDALAPAVCITPTELANFLSFAVAHYDVDPQRVYLTGLSCGAIGSWNYLAEHAGEIVAAAVLISGGGYGAIDEGGCAIAGTPIWALHGVRDDVVPVRYDVNSIARLQACTDPLPVDARLTLYPDAGHDAWTRTYDLSAGNDIYSWLLGYTK
jgi:predicted esterase